MSTCTVVESVSTGAMQKRLRTMLTSSLPRPRWSVRCLPPGDLFVVLPSCRYGGRTGKNWTHPYCEGTVAAPHPTESSGIPHGYQQRIPACPGPYGQIRSLRI